MQDVQHEHHTQIRLHKRRVPGHRSGVQKVCEQLEALRLEIGLAVEERAPVEPAGAGILREHCA